MKVQRETHNTTYAANIQAVHQTASWMLGAATAANSAGFYFAMNALPTWPNIASAAAFVVSLASTFWSGVLVTRVHAAEAQAADQVRRITKVNFHHSLEQYGLSSTNAADADQLLSRWSKVAIVGMAVGGALLIAGKIL